MSASSPSRSPHPPGRPSRRRRAGADTAARARAIDRRPGAGHRHRHHDIPRRADRRRGTAGRRRLARLALAVSREATIQSAASPAATWRPMSQGRARSPRGFARRRRGQDLTARPNRSASWSHGSAPGLDIERAAGAAHDRGQLNGPAPEFRRAARGPLDAAAQRHARRSSAPGSTAWSPWRSRSSVLAMRHLRAGADRGDGAGRGVRHARRHGRQPRHHRGAAFRRRGRSSSPASSSVISCGSACGAARSGGLAAILFSGRSASCRVNGRTAPAANRPKPCSARFRSAGRGVFAVIAGISRRRGPVDRA